MNYTFTRSIPTDTPYDLVVAGGGPAGSAAAICAARLGARVLLVEAMGSMGGMGSNGLVTAWDPMADGEKMLVGGFMRELIETLHSRGFTSPHVVPDFWRKFYHFWTPFKPEGLKLILDEFATAAGVEIRYFTRVIDVDVDVANRRVNGVIVNNIEGHRFVPAKAFIDATGDAVLCNLAGVECRVAGYNAPPPMPPTLCSLCCGIDWTRATKDPFQNCADHQQQYLETAIGDGHFSHRDKHLPGLFRIGKTSSMTNAGHVFGTDALNNKSLSAAMIRGRQLVQEYVSFYKKYVPGCEEIELLATGSLLGVRESRRIVGEYELTIDDYLARRKFDDQIGLFNKAVDIHVMNDSDEEYRRFCDEFADKCRLGRGESFGIPYRILVPRGWTNLWVAGRCNSSDRQVHGSIRVMPAAAMMGQAAGTAAVQAIQHNQTACGLDTRQLCDTLRQNGANLPE